MFRADSKEEFLWVFFPVFKWLCPSCLIDWTVKCQQEWKYWTALCSFCVPSNEMTLEFTGVRLPMTSTSAVGMCAFSYKVSREYTPEHSWLLLPSLPLGSTVRTHTRHRGYRCLWHCPSSWNVTLYHSSPFCTCWRTVKHSCMLQWVGTDNIWPFIWL